MDWDTIRQLHPHRWVVVEVFGASTKQGARVIPHLELIAAFGDDWKPAWDRYKALHHADPAREYTMLHTDREALDIGVLDAFGRVVARILSPVQSSLATDLARRALRHGQSA